MRRAHVILVDARLRTLSEYASVVSTVATAIVVAVNDAAKGAGMGPLGREGQVAAGGRHDLK